MKTAHVAKEIRVVGLLKFIRNLDAHAGQMVAAGRFESVEAVHRYLLDPFPWLVIAVYTLDQQHHVSSRQQETVGSSDGVDNPDAIGKGAAETAEANPLAQVLAETPQHDRDPQELLASEASQADSSTPTLTA